MVYNTHMKKTTHLPSKLSRLLDAIEADGRGLSWMPYRDACVDVHAHGLDMPDSLASYHMSAIASRWKQEGCELPISL